MAKQISAQEVKQLLESDEVYALLDVRERNKYESGQIFGATQVSRQSLELRIPVLFSVKNIKIVLYDEEGDLAAFAANTLEKHGYINVYILDGGIRAWQEAGFPLVEGVHVLSKAFGEIVGELRKDAPAILPQELKILIESSTDYITIEVRPEEEVQKTGSIPGAINIPGVEIISRIGDYVKSGRKIILTCAGRTRSFIAVALLKKMGIDDVYDLKNGTLGWRLAGYQLDHDIPLAPAPSFSSLNAAERFAIRLASEENIPLISVDKFSELQQNSTISPLYLLDVRTESEYNYIGHIPGAISIPGGQAIQNTDDVAPVREANIVFVCDNGTRSIVTAYWYKQMGFNHVYVLDGGIDAWLQTGNETEKGHVSPIPLGFSEASDEVAEIGVYELNQLLDNQSRVTVIDVDDSKSFARWHISGAKWVPRGKIEQQIGVVVHERQIPLVITSHTNYDSVFAAKTLLKLGYADVRVLKGGNEAWLEEGYAIKQGMEEFIPDDQQIHLTEYGLEEARKYFRWEESLVYLPEYMEYFQRKKII